MCEHRFCSQTKTRGDRNCTACFSLANIFNQSTNKSFGAKLQSEVTGGFTQVRIGNLINQSATSCAISIPPLLEACSEQKTFKDFEEEKTKKTKREDSDVDFEASRRSTRVQSKSTIRSALFLAKH